MPFAKKYSQAEAQLMMTLSALAYTDETPLPKESKIQQEARMKRDINSALSISSYRDWQVVWGPGLDSDRSNMMYVAKNQVTNDYAVVIRGTDWSFLLDWLEDLDVLALRPFPYVNDPKVQIAKGTYLGLEELIQITGNTPNNQPLDLLTFLKQAVSNNDIFVTGHSLGGCLASVVAPWLASKFGSASNLKVYTFAAPSAGNSDFANYYNQLFLDSHQVSTAYRIYNSLDVVPNAWATLDLIKSIYEPYILTSTEIKDVIDYAQGYVKNNYSQVGLSSSNSVIQLPGQILFSPPTQLEAIDPVDDFLFLLEAGWQHESQNYLNLLETKPISAKTAKLSALRASNRLQSYVNIN